MAGIDPDRTFVSLHIAVLTVSDTRTAADDRSGDTLVARLEAAGHQLAARRIVPDDVDAIISQLRAWVADEAVQVVLTTGGTGITGRDITPEACSAVFDKVIPGFGELFRWQSYRTIGSSTIQSRAIAGLAGTTLIFALPGSTGACKDAWDGILVEQLDARFRPCNFVDLMPRLGEV